MSFIKNLKKLLKPLGIIVVLVIFYYLGKSIVDNWDSISPRLKEINIYIYFASFFLLLVSQIYVVILWRFIVNTGKNRISVKDAIAIFYLSALGRYIPGKVWQLVGLAYFSEGAGIESEVAITASLLSQSLSVITGILVSAGAVIMYIKWYFVLPVVILMMLFLYPPVFNKILNFLSRRLRGKSVKMDMTLLKELALFFGYIFAWALYGFSFYLLFKAFAIKIGLLKSIQFFASSYLLGLFAIFVPGGLGVREGILMVLLKEIGIAGYLGSMIAIVERINITITELLLGLFGLVRILLRQKS